MNYILWAPINACLVRYTNKIKIPGRLKTILLSLRLYPILIIIFHGNGTIRLNNKPIFGYSTNKLNCHIFIK